MGFRFRRRMRVPPGLWVNFSKSGPLSLSAGLRGITTNIGRKGTRLTGSIRGTGLSYRTRLRPYTWWVLGFVVGAVILLLVLAIR